MEAFTPRNVAKWVATTAISFKTGKVVQNAISDHTRFDNDDLIVELAGGLTGWYAGHKTKPFTDKMVDKAADWINERKENKPDQDKTDKE